jgi:hypothetical protein
MLNGGERFRGNGIAPDIQLSMPWDFDRVYRVILVTFHMGECNFGVKQLKGIADLHVDINFQGQELT